jgi:CheY-like chemotaxis protein
MAIVLVVDDAPDVCHLLARLVKLSGHRAIRATSGRAAILQARAEHPHLVILDFNMPGMDGLDVLRELRSDPALGDTKVVMFSAVSDAGVRARALASGALEYWVKGGFDFREFGLRISSLLAGPIT